MAKELIPGRNLFLVYQAEARRKNREWGLSFKTFKLLTSSRCFYCRKPPAKVRRGYVYNGLDRKDNNLGYILDNVVPCCWECNNIKSSILTHEEMIVAMKAIMKVRGREKGGGKPDPEPPKSSPSSTP